MNAYEWVLAYVEDWKEDIKRVAPMNKITLVRIAAWGSLAAIGLFETGFNLFALGWNKNLAHTAEGYIKSANEDIDWETA